MFFASFLFSIIPLTILIALVVMSIRAIWLGVVPPRRCVKEASCEKCKYPVAGLSTWTCPECGSHLLTVGIITRSMEIRRRGSYVGAISGVFFLVLVVGLIALGVLLGTLGSAAGMFGAGRTIQTSPMTESSGVLPAMTLSVEQDWSTGMPPIAILRPAGATGFDELRVDLGNGPSFKRFGKTGQVSAEGQLDKEAMTQWMADAGVNVADPTAATAIWELTTYLGGSNIQNGMWVSSVDLPSFAVGNVSTTTKPPAGQENAYFWVLAMLWSIPAAGVLSFTLFAFLIIRRRRKLLRDADALTSAPSPGEPPLAPPPAAA